MSVIFFDLNIHIFNQALVWRWSGSKIKMKNNKIFSFSYCWTRDHPLNCFVIIYALSMCNIGERVTMDSKIKIRNMITFSFLYCWTSDHPLNDFNQALVWRWSGSKIKMKNNITFSFSYWWTSDHPLNYFVLIYALLMCNIGERVRLWTTHIFSLWCAGNEPLTQEFDLRKFERTARR